MSVAVIALQMNKQTTFTVHSLLYQLLSQVRSQSHSMHKWAYCCQWADNRCHILLQDFCIDIILNDECLSQLISLVNTYCMTLKCISELPIKLFNSWKWNTDFGHLREHCSPYVYQQDGYCAASGSVTLHIELCQCRRASHRHHSRWAAILAVNVPVVIKKY
jgi:hypothetical protein